MPLIKCPNPQCGCMISTNATTCPKCGHVMKGSSQNNGGSQQTYYPPQQPYYPPQQAVQQNCPPQPTYQPDQANFGLCILSFLIPLFGWIYYFVKRKDFPVKAKSCCNWAWIGFGANLLISILGGI